MYNIAVYLSCHLDGIRCSGIIIPFITCLAKEGAVLARYVLQVCIEFVRENHVF